MQSEIKNIDENFETHLFKHCKEGQTGTILIATNNNKSCQISLENGEIVAVTMGRVKGYEAASELAKGGIKKASFTQNMKFPHTKQAFIGSSEKFINKLDLAAVIPTMVEAPQAEQQVAAA